MARLLDAVLSAIMNKGGPPGLPVWITNSILRPADSPSPLASPVPLTAHHPLLSLLKAVGWYPPILAGLPLMGVLMSPC